MFKRISKILCNSKFFGPAPLPRHYRATTFAAIFHDLISPTLCFLFFVLGSQTTHAGVVLSSTLAGNGDTQGKVIGTSSANTNGLGIVFTTGNSSNWNLRSIQLALTTGSGNPRGTYSGGTVSFFLYTLTGTSALTANSLTYVGSSTATLDSFSGVAVTKTLTFSGSELNNLSAGTQYLLGMNFEGSVTGAANSNFLKVNSTTSLPTEANSSGWTVSSGYSYLVGNYSDLPTNVSAFSSSTTNVDYAYNTSTLSGAGFILDAEAAAVPEPGTLILFGVTMAAGCAGAWLKRRKQKSE